MAALFFIRRWNAMDLDFVRIECDVSTDNVRQLTALLYCELRNYEVHFKKYGCLTSHKVCPSCNQHGECPYWIIFSQKLSSDPEIVRLHQKPPLPFALSIEERVGSYLTDVVSVGLVVIGTAVNYVDFFYTALCGMVETAVRSVLDSERYSLHTYVLDYQGIRHEVAPGTSLSEHVMLFSGYHVLHNSVHSEIIRISLKSHLRLLCNGSIIRLFDFAAFFRSQMRRCSSLCAYYGSGEMILDFVQLSDLAQKVTVIDDQIRYSQPRWSKLKNKAGLTGSAVCSGVVEPMVPLLLLGSYFNAGKGAAFGFGQYKTEVM